SKRSSTASIASSSRTSTAKSSPSSSTRWCCSSKSSSSSSKASITASAPAASSNRPSVRQRIGSEVASRTTLGLPRTMSASARCDWASRAASASSTAAITEMPSPSAIAWLKRRSAMPWPRSLAKELGDETRGLVRRVLRDVVPGVDDLDPGVRKRPLEAVERVDVIVLVRENKEHRRLDARELRARRLDRDAVEGPRGCARVRARDDSAVLLRHGDAVARLQARAPVAHPRAHPIEVRVPAVERERRLVGLELADEIVARLDRADVGVAGVEEHERVDVIRMVRGKVHADRRAPRMADEREARVLDGLDDVLRETAREIEVRVVAPRRCERDHAVA